MTAASEPSQHFTPEDRAALRELIAQRPPVTEPPFRRWWGTIASIVTVLAVGWQINIEVGRVFERVDSFGARLQKLEALVPRLAVVESRTTGDRSDYERLVRPALDQISTQLDRFDARLQALERQTRRRTRRK